MDFNASLRRAIKTGNVILGQNNTEKCIKEGKAQMIVIAGNCPANFKSKLTDYENLFMVSTLAIVTPGESDILSLKRA
jgi:large subunit ribosomal protein L30e